MIKRSGALALAAGVALSGFAAFGPVYAAGQDDDGRSPGISMEYEGTTYFLIKKLDGDEILELISGNTLIFVHPGSQEIEYHQERGATINGREAGDNAKTGFWQVEEDEICWTYGSGTHCKPVYQSNRPDLYGQVPGWYGQPLPFFMEPGDSRAMIDRPIDGNAI